MYEIEIFSANSDDMNALVELINEVVEVIKTTEHSIFVACVNTDKAVEIINTLGFETDEDCSVGNEF